MLTAYFIKTDKDYNNIWVHKCEQQFIYIQQFFKYYDIQFKIVILNTTTSVYSSFLRYIWGKDDIIIVERDMYLSVKNIKEMIDCNYKLVCSAQYNLQPIPITLNIHYNRANRNTTKTKIKLSHNAVIYISFAEEYCDYGAFGLVKISKEVQQNVILPFHKWNDLDSIFYTLFIFKYGLKKVHNHKEISHQHIY